MANFTFTSGTQTVTTTEYSFAQLANYSSGSPKTVQGTVYVIFDLLALVAGDVYQLRVYERVNAGTQAPVFDAVVTGVQAQHYAFPAQLLGDGWDVTAKKISGNDRSIKCSVRQDTNDVNALTVSAAAITAIAAAIPNAAANAAAFAAAVVETGTDIVGGTISVVGSLRVLLSRAVGRGSGYLTGAIVHRDLNNSKNRVVGTAVPGGDGRTATLVDPT